MTLTLYLLACHAAGDFVLQTDRMAEQKFDDLAICLLHCAVYTAVFLPVVVAVGWSVVRTAAFATIVFAIHAAIDSRRWNDAVPIWSDQALHVIALALAVAVSGVVAA